MGNNFGYGRTRIEAAISLCSYYQFCGYKCKLRNLNDPQKIFMTFEREKWKINFIKNNDVYRCHLSEQQQQ